MTCRGFIFREGIFKSVIRRVVMLGRLAFSHRWKINTGFRYVCKLKIRTFRLTTKNAKYVHNFKVHTVSMHTGTRLLTTKMSIGKQQNWNTTALEFISLLPCCFSDYLLTARAIAIIWLLLFARPQSPRPFYCNLQILDMWRHKISINLWQLTCSDKEGNNGNVTGRGRRWIIRRIAGFADVDGNK